jgi:hypothetical protein
MKLEGKWNRKKFSFEPSKRNVKIWVVNDQPQLFEWNLNEPEPRPIERNRMIIYHAEMWNGVLEYVNNAKVKVVQDVED